MNEDQRNADASDTQEYLLPATIEAEANNQPKTASQQSETLKTEKSKSIRRGWKQSSAPTKLMVWLTAIICGANIIYAGFAFWQLRKMAEQTNLSAEQLNTFLFLYPKKLREEGIYLIEDAAEAFMSALNGKYLGTFGHAGCLSFSPNKTITTGQGGMVLTDDEAAKATSGRGRGVPSFFVAVMVSRSPSDTISFALVPIIMNLLQSS
jgi:hypothetical protein